MWQNPRMWSPRLKRRRSRGRWLGSNRMNTEDEDKSSAPPLNPDLVSNIIGKRVLVGLTYLRYRGGVIEQKQLHGIVERINKHDGIVIRLPDDARFRLPSDLRGIAEAPPGVYRLLPAAKRFTILTTPTRGQ